MSNIMNTATHGISAAVESVLYAKNPAMMRAKLVATGILMGGIFLMSTTSLALAASDFDTYAANVSGKTNSVVDIVSYVSYIGGAVLAALGIVDLKKHVEQPAQNPLKNGLAKLGFGGMLLAMPTIAGVISGTVKDGSQVAYQPWTNKPTVTP